MAVAVQSAAGVLVALVRAEGIVLRGRDLGDTSRIVTAYTLEHGKIALVAKGARTPKSRFGSALQPGAHVALVFYQRETRELRFLSHADRLTTRDESADALETLTFVGALCEFLDLAIAGEEPHPEVYALAREALEAAPAVRSVDTHVTRLLALQIRLAALLGLRPEMHRCVGCRGSLPPAARFAARRGGLLCDACGERETESFAVSATSLAHLRLLGVGPLAGVRPVPASVEEEVETVVDVFLRCHLPHYGGLRGRHMLRRLSAMADA